MQSASVPAVRPVYLWANVGLRCATLTLPAPLSATPSLALSVYLRECVAAGSASAWTACPVRDCLPRSSHTPASLSPATARRVLSTLVPVSAPPTGLDECLFFISLVSDPLAVRFSCQFWLCEEAQCVCLCRHLGSPCSNIFIVKGDTLITPGSPSKVGMFQ